jgi:hypothetical protein
MGALSKQTSIVPEDVPQAEPVDATRMPILTPKEWPLQLMFFRKCYTALQAMYPDDTGVPTGFFQRAMARLFKILGHQQKDFDVALYDADGSGTVDWQEFISCYRDSKIRVRLSHAERIHVMFDPAGAGSSHSARIASTFIFLCIFISSMSFILQTLRVCRAPPDNDPNGEPIPLGVFGHIEFVSIIIFSVEYVIRLSTSYAMRQELFNDDVLLGMLVGDSPIVTKTPFQRFWSFLTEPSNVVDLLAIVPWYIEQFTPMNAKLTILRLVRLTRVLRVLRIGSIQDAIDTLGLTLVRSASSLYVLCFYIVLGVIISSSLIYFCEGGQWQPNVEGEPGDPPGFYMRTLADQSLDQTPFTSIPKAIWLVVVTVTTVGYGDIGPATNLGRLVGALTIIGGIVGFAMPMGVISSNFDRIWQEKEEKKEKERERKKQEMSLIASALRGNRLAELRIVVQDDDGLGERPEFLGECYIGLNTLGWAANKPGGASLTLKLQDNAELADRRVTGTISVNLLYQPEGNGAMSKIEEEKLLNHHRYLNGAENSSNVWENTDKMPALAGALTVEIKSAEGLLDLDSASSGASDPFCRVTLYPDQKDLVVWETQVIHDALCPTWGEKKMFTLNWSQEEENAEEVNTRASSRNQDYDDEDCSPEAMTEKLLARMQLERDFWQDKYDSLLRDAKKMRDFKVTPPG